MDLKSYTCGNMRQLEIDTVGMERTSNKDRFIIKCHKIAHIFKKGDVLYIKSDSNYSTIVFTGGQKILTSKTLKYWEHKLDDINLIRTHKSFSVNRDFILQIKNTTSEIKLTGNVIVPLSRSMKKYINQSFI